MRYGWLRYVQMYRAQVANWEDRGLESSKRETLVFTVAYLALLGGTCAALIPSLLGFGGIAGAFVSVVAFGAILSALHGLTRRD